MAALVGGLAGAVVGLMFAPKSGKELRQDVASYNTGALKQQSNRPKIVLKWILR
ncbi:YtxH domain-containing protein [Desulfosporosinus sp. BICA1-9]|uniref:YtxH domain-containing protein n=1 Tax=Desulfosporosinus sp. BICA1-9 TaxID=1531958 RepID=UPI0025C3FAD2|nr:YtxH domain-containing protein [Desulfosporosinus sp. BICA1-9]